MQTQDKQIIIILISISLVMGGACIGLSKIGNNTTNTTPEPTIIVYGNGSSGTGDVQNVQQVTQVKSNGGTTRTVYVEQKVTTAPTGPNGSSG